MDFSNLNKALAIKNGGFKFNNNQSDDNRQYILEIELDKIKADPNQPRKNFDTDKIQELAEDIKQNGLIQPIIIRQDGIGQYIVIAGERRLRAVQLNGDKTIKAIVQNDYKTENLGYIQIAENIKRDDLKFYELAEFIISRVDAGEKQSTIADKLGMNKKSVSYYLIWRDAPESIKAIKEKISSIRVFFDLVKLYQDHKDEVESYLEQNNQEEYFSKGDIQAIKDILNPPTSQEELKLESTDLQATEKELPISDISENNDFQAQAESSTSSADTEPMFQPDLENSSESFSDGSAQTLSFGSDEQAAAPMDSDLNTQNEQLEDAADDMLNVDDTNSQDKYKKPLILGFVDGREAELLFKFKCMDGMVKVKYEDGYEDVILADRFKLNRIIEA